MYMTALRTFLSLGAAITPPSATPLPKPAELASVSEQHMRYKCEREDVAMTYFIVESNVTEKK
jgi:hypothetical protein